MNIAMKKLICEDVLFDGKSLVYENGILKEVADPLDSSTVPEGRFGEFRMDRIRLKMGVVIQLPVTGTSLELSKSLAEEDSDVCYRRGASDRFFMLEKVDASRAAQMAADFGADENLVPWEADKPDETTGQWAGLLDSGSAGPMLGIVRILSGKNGLVYVLRYAGTGNFTDIRMEEIEIVKALYRRVAR